jgi:hypothetical protein
MEAVQTSETLVNSYQNQKTVIFIVTAMKTSSQTTAVMCEITEMVLCSYSIIYIYIYRFYLPPAFYINIVDLPETVFQI